MKAHLSSPLALLYGLPADTPAGRDIRALLLAMGAAPRAVAPAELDCPVGVLAGLDRAPKGRTEAPNAGPAPEEPALVMCRFSAAQVDSLLAALRAAGIALPLKAVLTEHNRAWSMRALLEELRREHAAMQAAARQRQA